MAANIESPAPDTEGKPAECTPDTPLDESTTGTSETLPESDMPQKLSGPIEPNALEESMQIAAQDSGYNSSGSSHHYPETQNEEVGNGRLIQTRSRTSSDSSVSSIPASTLTNLADGTKHANIRDEYMLHLWDHPASRQVQTLRQRDSGFRKLSSVRAMQMHTEDEGDDDYHLTPPKRRGSHRMSDISVRSAGSSPFKRSPFYSPAGAAGKPKVKKEYPLVLLHCTLLPPSLPVSGLAGHPDRQRILKEVLPSVYWKRWKLLEEKIGSGVLRDRGVLISHPEDMYDLLEERLLESLELQHPRLDHGHFMGGDESDSDREDRLAREDSSTEDEGDECPDCGGRVLRQTTNRKWEVKVFAANGLMRAGAWAAAWKEMEKVDVEVGLWLPADVRADLEKRLSEDPSHIANGPSGPVALLQEPENIQVEAPVRILTPGPERPDTLPHVTQAREGDLPQATAGVGTESQDNQEWNHHASKGPSEIDLQTLLINYIRVLANDRRNIVIAFLSVLVVFVAINSRPSAAPESDLRPFPAYIPEYTPSSVVSQQQPAAETWTENTSSRTQSVATSASPEILASTAVPLSPVSLEDVSNAPVEPSSAEPAEPSPTPAESLVVEDTDDIPEIYEPLVQSSESDTEESSPTEADTLPVESTESAAEEQKLPTQSSLNVSDEPSPSTAEPASADSADDAVEAEEPLQASQTPLVTNLSDEPVEDRGDDLPLPIDEPVNQSELSGEALEDDDDQDPPNDQHDPPQASETPLVIELLDEPVEDPGDELPLPIDEPDNQNELSDETLEDDQDEHNDQHQGNEENEFLDI